MALSSMMVALWSLGCGGSPSESFGGGFFTTTTGQDDTGTGTGTGDDDSGFFGGGGGGVTDPCDESLDRKFVNISMRNAASDDYIHYFVTFIAFVNGDVYPDGAVCEEDIDLYTSAGYEEISEGATREFGNYCIAGPALIRWHRNGQFQTGVGSGNSALGSAIAPAQGSSSTYDNFFTSSGAQMPVPNSILFHNPGTGDGAPLLISQPNVDPCGLVVGQSPDSDCEQDAFYYVSEDDRLAGSTALGSGSGRRVPNDVQGTGCNGGFDSILGTSATQVLGGPGTTASNADQNEFLRGGFIEYVYVRQDEDPPVPQLVWRVSDQGGTIIQEFDPRVDVP